MAGPSVEALVAEAIALLDRHQLPEAEACFQRALRHLAANRRTGTASHEELGVRSLIGLAEVFAKQGRCVRHHDLAWSYMLLQASTLQQEALNQCHKVIDDALMNSDSTTSVRWAHNIKERIAKQSKVLETSLINSFEKQLADALSKRVQCDEEEERCGMDTSFLTMLEKYVVQKVKENQESLVRLTQNLVPSVSSEDKMKKKKSKAKKVVEPVKKLDYDRVQRAIMKLVKQVSADMRSRFIRKRLSEETLRRTVSSEMIAKFAPIPDSSDILGLFENAVVHQEFRLKPEEFGTYHDLANAIINEDLDDKASQTSQQTSESPEGSESQSSQSSQDTIYLNYGAESGPTGAMLWTDIVKDTTFSGLSPQEESSYFLPGVITIWRSYNKTDHSLPPPLYRLQSYEEMSPLTESSFSFSAADNYNQDADAVDETCTQVIQRAEQQDHNLLNESKLKLTMATTLFNWAEKWRRDGKVREASELYKYSLGVFRHNPDDSTHTLFIAKILRNLGHIRCTQGDLTSGSQLMEEAVHMYRRANQGEDCVQVAQIYHDIACCFVANHLEQASIFEHVMELIKEVVESEVRKDSMGEEEDVPDDAASDSDCSDEEAYPLCTYEAITYHKSALSILTKLRRNKNDFAELYVGVLTNLADCHILVGNYDESILCYEEALSLCQSTLGSPSLPNSAHILSMLGTANFFLGTHSKAITMYETAHIIQQHLYANHDNFAMAFTQTMLGITFYVSRHYHRCVSWCLKAFELYTNIYRDKHASTVTALNRWFVVQTLYTLGFSYSTLSFHDRALHYLSLAKGLVRQSPTQMHIPQLVRVLKCEGDVHAATENHESALECYNQALDHCVSLGGDKSATALQNQLLNSMAGVHVSTKQYGTAAKYLEQALDYQKNVQDSIKGDLVVMLQQLGTTYALAGDLDKGIECFTECFDSYTEMQTPPGTPLASTLCSLAVLYHVKSCIQEDQAAIDQFLGMAEECYQDALLRDASVSVCAQYANFLYQQGQSADALLNIVGFMFQRKPCQEGQEIILYGPEQAVLPEHLQNDVDDIDEVVLDSAVFCRYLGILCYKNLGLMQDAEDVLECMCVSAWASGSALTLSMLGYALLEMCFPLEAAECFHRATHAHHDPELAETNAWLCTALWVYTTLAQTWFNVWEFTTRAYLDFTPSPTPRRAPHRPQYLTSDYAAKRDSGYYDNVTDTGTPGYSLSPVQSPPGERRRAVRRLSLSPPHGSPPSSRPTSLSLPSPTKLPARLTRWSQYLTPEGSADKDDFDDWHTVEETVESSLAELEAISQASRELQARGRAYEAAPGWRRAAEIEASSPPARRKQISDPSHDPLRRKLHVESDRDELRRDQVNETSPRTMEQRSIQNNNLNHGDELNDNGHINRLVYPLQHGNQEPSEVNHNQNYVKDAPHVNEEDYYDERYGRLWSRAPSTIYEEEEDEDEDEKAMSTSPEVEEGVDDIWETWETTEEVIETPPEILAAILQGNKPL